MAQAERQVLQQASARQVSFLNLLRSIGDALEDLVEEMLKAHNLAHADKLFNDAHCLANRFRDHNAARKLA